jgi:hypothetical protein
MIGSYGSSWWCHFDRSYPGKGSAKGFLICFMRLGRSRSLKEKDAGEDLK